MYPTKGGFKPSWLKFDFSFDYQAQKKLHLGELKLESKRFCTSELELILKACLTYQTYKVERACFESTKINVVLTNIYQNKIVLIFFLSKEKIVSLYIYN